MQDNGDGIPLEAQPYIFDRFYQLDNAESRQGEGTGIGLALVKELIQTLEGSIGVESKTGLGTTFTVRLPIRQQAVKKLDSFKTAPVPQEVVESSHPEAPLRTDTGLPTLLIIEDNPDVVFYIKSLLASQYAIETAENGSIGIIKAIESIPDIIISDVMMPEKDGFEVVQPLKQDERTCHIPIILLTAKATREDRLAGLQHGADAYLMKPFDKAELFVRLEQLVALRRALRARYANAAQSVFSSMLSENGRPIPPTLDDLFLQKIRQLIDEKIDDAELDVAAICKTVGLSDTQLHRKMKALTGAPPMSFIRKVRLHKARDLLQKTDLNVAEIAYRVGFTDASYFSRAFGKEFGTPPTDVRK